MKLLVTVLRTHSCAENMIIVYLFTYCSHIAINDLLFIDILATE